MKYPVSISLVLLTLFLVSCSPDKKSAIETDRIAKVASTQYQFLSSQLSNDDFPKTYENGELKTSNSGWWCSGFYPGTLLYLYEETNDDSLLNLALNKLSVLEKEKSNTTTHDLGFMMFCSFGNAYRITENEDYRQIVYESAKSLASRFNPVVGCIRSWDYSPWSAKWQYPVIIDNMMNLELLLWAGEEFNNPSLTEIAVTHANTTIANHFRDDFSSYHVVSFDTLTGEVEKKNTAQGYSDNSPWARGQAWGLYGFTVMHRFTKDQKYLDQAVGIADFILDHPNLPENKVPYWDFIAPNIPNAKRDASAAAITASALLELQKYVDPEKETKYFSAAEKILETLSGPEYLAEEGTNGGFILKHSVGHKPADSEVDVPISYADYYYIEALKRYKSQN